MEQNLTEVESLCMSCGQQGVTRLLLVRVPNFGELVVSSFACAACGASNRDLMPAATVRDRGVEWHLRVRSRADLNRQLVRSHAASLLLPSIELELPAGRARLTTVEGVLLGALEDLSPTAHTLEQRGDSRLAVFLERLRALLAPDSLSDGFALVLRDPSGHSFIERLADDVRICCVRTLFMYCVHKANESLDLLCRTSSFSVSNLNVLPMRTLVSASALQLTRRRRRRRRRR